MATPSFASLRKDGESLLSNIKHGEKQIQRKKRWLLGITATKTERKHFKKAKFLDDRFMPESFIREGDIFYESARTYVEGLFGLCHNEEFDIIQDDMLSIEWPSIKRLISCLDNMTTKGLYLLAEIITGGSVKFERGRGELKKIVKSFLSSALTNRTLGCHQQEIFKQLFELVKNQKTMSASRSQSNHAAVKKVLGDLKHFSSQTLKAMCKKLNREEATIPKLRTGRKEWVRRNVLIKRMREISLKMLSQLGEGDELQEPLAKAMAVTDLSLKLENHNHILSKTFYQPSPKVKSLQDDIMKAIWLVKNEVGIPVLRELSLRLDPQAKISERLLKSAFTELLTEFLFECNDMDKIPERLLNVLDVINGSLGNRSPQLLQERIKEEVDHILNVSAQMKQIVLDLLPDHGFDEDFSDVYVEQLVESDEDECNTEVDLENVAANFYCEAIEPEPTKNEMRRNEYLTIQYNCDQTSMLTNKFIGHLLWEFAKSEGLDLNGSQSLCLRGDNQIRDEQVATSQQSSSSKTDPRNSAIIGVIKELAPSFSYSAMKRLKKLIR